MIITVTGKPCSGKGTACKLFSQVHNFEYLCTGDMMRELATKHNLDILTFQKTEDIRKIDKIIDDQIADLGKSRINDDIIIDSRLAWHFIPDSFKVFIDVSLDVASQRLLSSNRDSEQTSNEHDAMQKLCDRWETENDRYLDLYGVNNLNLDNYDFVINSDDLSPEEIVEKILEAYKNFKK